MPVVNFKLSNDEEMVVVAEEGWTLMEAARKEGVPGIVAECGGGATCSTCHVFILEPWIEKVGPPSDLEDMLLEMAPGRDEQCSRLSCQIKMTAELDGIAVRVPDEQYE